METAFIKNHRKKLKITQKEMAKYVGVNIKTYSGYENGNDMPLSVFMSILKRLDLVLTVSEKGNTFNL